MEKMEKMEKMENTDALSRLPNNLLQIVYGFAGGKPHTLLMCRTSLMHLMCVNKAFCNTLTHDMIREIQERFESHKRLAKRLCKTMHQLAFVFRCRSQFPRQYLPAAYIKKVFRRLGNYESQSLQIVFNNCKETRRYVWTLLLRTSEPCCFTSLYTVKASYHERYSSFYPLHNSSCSRLFVTIFDAFWFTGNLLSIEPIMMLRLGVSPNIRSGEYEYWKALVADYAMVKVMETIEKWYEETKQKRHKTAPLSTSSYLQQ